MKRKAVDILKEALALPSGEDAVIATSLRDSLDTAVDEDAAAARAEPSRASFGSKFDADSSRADA